MSPLPSPAPTVTEANISQLLVRRARALAGIRQRLGNIKVQERDARARLVDANSQLSSIRRESSPPNGHARRRQLKERTKVLQAELEESADVETQLTDLLSRLTDLQHIQETKGTLASCEKCQVPIHAEMLPHCAPEGNQWDVFQALLVCPNCL